MSDPKLSERGAAVQRWALPEVGGRVIGRHPDERNGADLVRATQEAEARGYQAGLARAQAEMQPHNTALAERVQRLDSILHLLEAPLQQLDAEVEKTLLQLALSVGKQLARRELRADPTQIIGIIRESLAQLSPGAREVRIHLHPEDAATVRERLPAAGQERAWTITEDPTLTRGGCVVRTDTSQIDVRLESRINAVIAAALGEERTTDRPLADAAGTDP